jgi:hypothetical protein
MRAQLAGESQNEQVAIDLESLIEGKAGPGNIVCTSGDKKFSLLTVNEMPSRLLAEDKSGGRIALLNTHTYSQADFDAVREVLLCPRPLGLLAMDGPALAALREAFGNGAASLQNLGIPAFDGPSCITFHPFGSSGGASSVIQNFNDKPVNVTITLQAEKDTPREFVEAFSEKPIPVRVVGAGNRVALDLPIPARGRIWIRGVK